MTLSPTARESSAGITPATALARSPRACGRWLLAAAGALLVASCAAYSTVAQAQRPGVAFDDTRAWNLKWDVLKEPQRVNVCNVSGITALLPEAVVSTFAAGEAEPADIVTVALETPADDKSPGWQAGECRLVTLSQKANVTPAAGSHAGVVSVRSSVGIARRTVTISGPNGVAEPAVAEGALDPTVLSATRRGPLWKDKTSLDDDGKLLLKRTADKKLKVPACDPSKPSRSTTPSPKATPGTTPAATGGSAAPATTSTMPQTTPSSTTATTRGTPAAPNQAAPAKSPAKDSDENCPFVGNIHNGTHVAKVFVASPIDDDDPEQPAVLKLRLSEAREVGTYTGALDLAQTADNAKDDIKVSVNVNDHWLSALGALVLGALLFALLPQYILRRWLPKRRMHKRIDGFKARYAAAITAFNKQKPSGDGLGPWKGPSDDDIKDIADELWEAAKRYWRSTVYFDGTSEAHKELERSVAYVEDDIDCLQKPERLPAKLTLLKTTLDDLRLFLNTKYRTLGAPRFVVPLAALLKGPAPPEPPATGEARLRVGQALATADAADAATILVASWRKLADDLLTYLSWCSRLKQDAVANSGNWEPRHRVVLDAAENVLAEAKHELLHIADATELVEFDTAGDLKRAYARLAYLSGLHGHWPRDDEEASGAGATDDESVAPAPNVRGFAVPIPDEKEHKVQTWVKDAGEVRCAAAKAPKLRDDRWLIWAGWFAVLLTATTAVTAALAAFYFSKDWGTTEDYLTIIVAAVLAQVVVQTVTEAIGRTLPPMPKRLISEAVAARLKPLTTPATPVAAVAATPTADAPQ